MTPDEKLRALRGAFEAETKAVEKARQRVRVTKHEGDVAGDILAAALCARATASQRIDTFKAFYDLGR